ncbi:hypothetical protein FRC08_006272 [Ceratobasidium sp. 394]|nr:hypothetical protein FRC08_006272 [Ceratobasidium sp. 394]
MLSSSDTNSPPPPSDDDHIKIRIQLVQAQALPAEIKDALRTSITNTLAAGNVSDFVEEIRKLGQDAIEIDRSFHEVSTRLKKVDDARFDKPKLQPKWQTLQKKYTKILWGSRDTATKVESHLDHLNLIVVPMIEDAISDPKDDEKFNLAISELAGLTGERNPSSQIADGRAFSTHSQDFIDLRRKVEAFVEEFDITKAEVSLAREIDTIKGEISLLKKKILNCDLVLLAIIAAIGTFAAVTGLLTCLGTLGPAFVITALAGWKEKRDKAIATRKDFENQVQLLKDAKASLNEHKSTMVERLDKLAQVWSTISHEAELLANTLKAARNSGSPAVG